MTKLFTPSSTDLARMIKDAESRANASIVRHRRKKRHMRMYLRQWCRLHGVEFNRHTWLVRRHLRQS
jgi:hypothetical protein